MGIELGSGTINKVYLGSTEINKVYLGSTEIYAPSGDTIVGHASLTTNLLGYYKFDTDANDSTDNSNDISITEASLTTGNGGKINEAYGFDGVNDYGDVSAITRSDTMSYSFWLKPANNTQTKDLMVNILATDDTAFRVRQQGSVWRAYWSRCGVSSQIGSSTTTITGGTWYHVVAVFNVGGTGRLYINGTEEDTFTMTDTNGLCAYSDEHTIGGWRITNPGYWEGDIDEVGVWNKELTSGEVTDLYNSGNGLPYN